jgi:hypothetical protein
MQSSISFEIVTNGRAAWIALDVLGRGVMEWMALSSSENGLSFSYFPI